MPDPRRPKTSLRAKRARLAAAFAISNFGYTVPLGAALHPEDWSESAQANVEDLAGHLMESREHERLFGDEARMWYAYVRKHPRKVLLEMHGYHPWVKAILYA
jgi:hypothetical protein